MDNKNNNRNSNNVDYGTRNNTSIIVTKGDTLVIIGSIVIIALCALSYQMGVVSEKIGQLEDVVFINGIYKDIAKDK